MTDPFVLSGVAILAAPALVELAAEPTHSLGDDSAVGQSVHVVPQ